MEDAQIPVTEKPQIILARRGQGKFRERVSRIEHACRITGVNRPEHLIASHCNPWRDCESHDERLDGENGLLPQSREIQQLCRERCGDVTGTMRRHAIADGYR